MLEQPPYAHVSVCGDVIGPAFPHDEPVNLERLFPTGHGRFGKGTEYHAFNLGANTWQLHYFRLTNQLQAKWDLAKKVFEQVSGELLKCYLHRQKQVNMVCQK